MFDPMLQTRTVDVQVRSRWAFPVSVLSHIMVIGVIVAASLMVTVSLKDPEPFIIFAALAPLPPPPAPALPAGPAATDSRQQVEEIVPEPDEILQPHETLEELPIVEESGGEDIGRDAGVLGGVPGGDPDGVPGGVLDGVPGGPLGSTGPAEQIPRIVTSEMTPPVLKRKLEPEYPELARNSRLQGRVILQAVISTTGKVEEVTILRSSNPLFDEAAIDAVRQWEYEPARQGGRPVAVYFTIDVLFSLR